MKSIFIGILFIIISISLNAQNSAFSNFKLNESISYCITSRSTPNNIVRLDNNWDLLIALRRPKTIKEMDSIGIEFTYSQLELLRQWNLIHVDKKSIKPNTYNILFSYVLDGMVWRRLEEKSVIKKRELTVENLL